MNGFLLATVPAEIFFCLPAFFALGGFCPEPFWLVHPGVAAIRLIGGQTRLWPAAMLSLGLWCAAVRPLCIRAARRSLCAMKGGTL